MAALIDNKPPAKILMIGDSGGGKTGSLVSLAKAGFNVNLLDFDNGHEILYGLLADDEAALRRVDVETHTDDYKQSGNSLIAVTPLKGFSGGMKVLNDWPGKGKPTTWGPDTVLVLDSLTLMGRFIMNHVLHLNNRLQGPPQLQDWGAAMDLQENVMAMLYSPSIRCHVIVMSHITYIAPEGEVVQKGYPSALGSKLPPKIGRYFNSTLLVRSVGVGTARKRVIETDTVGQIELKTPAPGKVKKQYALETGLAEYFADLGHKPTPAK